MMLVQVYRDIPTWGAMIRSATSSRTIKHALDKNTIKLGLDRYAGGGSGVWSSAKVDLIAHSLPCFTGLSLILYT
jgi:hypothetical protein